MSWAWLALCPDPVTGSTACAEASHSDGGRAGFLCAWEPSVEPPWPSAAKVDARALDHDGSPGLVSLVLAPDGLSLPFDDPAVAQATRRVLAMPPADVFSTLVVSDDRFVGSLTATRGAPGRLGFDPFANLFPAVVLQLGAGLLGRMASPVGPVTQRYGASNPWPWDRFDEGGDRLGRR